MKIQKNVNAILRNLGFKAKKAFNKYKDSNAWLDAVYRNNKKKIDAAYADIPSRLSKKTRFKNKLEIVWDIKANDFLLPALTVQPLVENAVKHGICKSENGGRLAISSRELDDRYEIEVSDNGIGFDVNTPPNDGKSHLGIENVRNRLWKMCKASLELSSEVGKGTSAVIILPKKTKNTEGKAV